MFVIRPVKPEDLDDLFKLAEVMAPGITTFPPDKSKLIQKIIDSKAAFNLAIDHPGPRSFLLVLEDIKRNRVAGTAGIYSHIGHDTPFYSFKITKQTQINQALGIRVCSKALHLVNDFDGATEVGTLLIHPDYSGLGLGKLLARSRYLLIKTFITLFNEPVFAELRGISDDNNESPFWNSVGKHFFGGISFDKADLLSATTDKQFIADLFPRYPIYVDLLPTEAQEALSKANKKGQAALTMLLNEGFRDEGYVDIFDAGVTVTASFADMRTIRDAQFMQVQPGTVSEQQNKIIIGTTVLTDYRILQTSHYQLEENSLIIPDTLYGQLKLDNNQVVII
jgi:arginine N-succinyltransferase